MPKTIRNHRSLLFNKNSNKLSLNYTIQCLQAWIVQGKGKYVHDLRIAQSVIEAKLIILTLFRVFRVDIFSLWANSLEIAIFCTEKLVFKVALQGLVSLKRRKMTFKSPISSVEWRLFFTSTFSPTSIENIQLWTERIGHSIEPLK